MQGVWRWVPLAADAVLTTVRWCAHRTGLPAIVVAAIAMTSFWFVLRRTARFAVGVVVSMVLLLGATWLGWITW